jgi:alpha-mannosidase
LDFRASDINLNNDMPPEVFTLKDSNGVIIPYSIQEMALDSSRKMRYQGRTFSIEFMAKVPAMGYAVFHLSPSEEEEWSEFPVSEELITTDLSIENQFYKIIFANNGSFTIYEKKSKKSFPNCHIFIDEADIGNEYDFVPLLNDRFINSFYKEATLLPGKQTPYSTTFEIEFTLYLPDRLTEDRSKRSSEENDVFINTQVTLFAGDPVIHIHTQIDNACEDHRLRVLFPSGLSDAKCFVKEAFHVQERSMIPPKTGGWLFPPTGSDHTGGFSSLVDAKTQFSVFNKGLPNYEVLSNPIPEIEDEYCIAQTLFRAVGWLGHPQVKLPDGRSKFGAGPTMRTIDSQMLGEFSFEYGLYICEGTCESARIPAVFQTWAIELGSIIPYDLMDPYNILPFPRKLSFYFNMSTPKPISTNHSLPSTMSFIELVGMNIEFSTLKAAEKGDGIILRLWNSARSVNEAKIKCYKVPKKVVVIHLDETEKSDQNMLSVAGSEIILKEIKPSEIITLKLVF